MDTEKVAETEKVTVYDIVGWYDFQWTGGTFNVCFRPAGCFFAPFFQQPSKWELTEDGIIKIDWGKYGKYEMKMVDKKTKTMEGSLSPPGANADRNWRKAVYVGPLSGQELALIGDGGGSEWNWSWTFEGKSGEFPVKFKCDGYNHFQCDDHPAHAHWSLGKYMKGCKPENMEKLQINWDSYGTYVMTIDPEKKTMEGCFGKLDGTDVNEKDARKASHVKNLLNNAVVEYCEHHH